MLANENKELKGTRPEGASLAGRVLLADTGFAASSCWRHGERV